MTTKLSRVFAKDCGKVIRIHSYAKHIQQRTGDEPQQQLQHGHAILSGIQVVEILRIIHPYDNHLHIHVQLARTILANDFIAVLKRILLVRERFVVIAELLLRQREEESSFVSQTFVGKELNRMEDTEHTLMS